MRSFVPTVWVLAGLSALVITSSSAFVVSPRAAVVSAKADSSTKPLTELTSSTSGEDKAASPSKFEKVAASFSQSAAVRLSQRYKEAGPVADHQSPFNLITLIRVGIPSVLGGIFATLIFPGLALFLASIMNDAGVFTVLAQDSSQFVQNFLTVSGLLFSILVGQT